MKMIMIRRDNEENKRVNERERIEVRTN